MDPKRIALLLEYEALRKKGLRKNALKVLDDFIRQTSSWSTDECQRFVDWYMTRLKAKARRLTDCPQVVDPLLQHVIRPVLEAWHRDDPGSAIPARWLGWLSWNESDLTLYEHALSVEPTDSITRELYVKRVYHRVEYLTHELPWGYLSQDPQAELDLIDSALPRALPRCSAQLRALRALIQSYLEWKMSDRELPFQEWAIANDRPLSFDPRKY